MTTIEEVAQDNLTLFLDAQERARQGRDAASTQAEKAYWQGVKDGLRKCYAIFANDPQWQAVGGSSAYRPVEDRI